MDVPVLIVTYKRFDFVLEILQKLMLKNLKRIYLSVDDYYSNVGFEKVETYLESNGFEYHILKWEENVGCDRNVMEGIRWFFKYENKGLILEDDCIPVEGYDNFLYELDGLDIKGNPVSFFSTNSMASSSPVQLYPSLLPIYWGWYSTKEFFYGFYEFYSHPPKTFAVTKKIWCSAISYKLKLVVMINYLAHRAGKKGIAWDSELLAYLIYCNKRFWVPSVSFINNKGFGDLSSAHTHTSSIPVWYDQVSWLHSAAIFPGISLQTATPASDNLFLEAFFSSYSNKKTKLLGTLVKAYLQFTLRKRAR